ncbi:homoserine kinase [Luteococcus sp. Sow4_B9]|uniref:homoserine kinase n=1 Tax=Luteococcus sp. Sow4_B9 TaxID=3438792 RepID=UPI003F945B02
MLPVGARAQVSVPATSANLGPGFDCMGLAVEMRDRLGVEVIASGLDFDITGEGAQQVPRDGSHLVVRVLTQALDELGASAPGLRLSAHNVVPHSRGLGSSAAAIVAGLALAWALVHPGEDLDLDWLCERSTEWEGHPDNACAAVLGGIVLAWSEESTQVVRLAPAAGLSCIAWVPSFEVRTADARAVLPGSIPRADAVAQAACSALLVHALTQDPARLMAATVDRLHQPQRAPLMEPSAALIRDLRAVGVPAVVSGAGPTVLAIGTDAHFARVDEVVQTGFVRHDLAIGSGVRLETSSS